MNKDGKTSENLANKLATYLITFAVAANGLLIIMSVLVAVLFRARIRTGSFGPGFYILIGLTLVYLSSLLSRKKRIAWIVAVPLYAVILIINAANLADRPDTFPLHWSTVFRNIVLPAVVFFGLLLFHEQFTVRSDLRSFRSSVRFTALILAITLIFGVVGFELLDVRDFHQEISVPEAVHRTIDQFDLTTSNPLVPHTRRAKLFLDSLSIISVGAIGYGLISLFQPLRARFADQTYNRHTMAQLLERFPSNSEDFFKLWPHDKGYFFTTNKQAGLAYHVHRGNALIVGDLAGDENYFDQLIDQFEELCYVNDWTPAFIHTQPKYNDLYRRHGYELQKIGEEAIVDIDHFLKHVANNKYFRNITNKFNKAGYRTELLTPPHSHEVVERLRAISNDWLTKPGREERGFVLGYFTNTYIQQCKVIVALNKQSQYEAFINQIYSFDNTEANFDMLRHSSESTGNINDYLLINFINAMKEQDYKKVNLGLSPLSGLDNQVENKGLVDSLLKFVYANGDKLYSFSGLRRFKEKYEPNWSDRYIAYKGGITGFTSAVSALNKVWKTHFYRSS